MKGITRASWKSNPAANGALDVLLDLGTHWTDLIFSLLGPNPVSTQIRMSSVLPERPSQDTLVAVNFEYASGAYAYASLSKVAHGAANELEIAVLGTKGGVSWKGSAPDEIKISKGSSSSVERRTNVMKGSGLPPFHGLGWNEGYAEILVDVLSEQMGIPHRPYPTLGESLAVLRALLGASRSCAIVPLE